MKFTSETGKAARAAWAEKYEGTDQHREWCSTGYWTAGGRIGWKRTNIKVFGEHLPKSEYRRRCGWRQLKLKGV